jgi:hypothetical protein
MHARTHAHTHTYTHTYTHTSSILQGSGKTFAAKKVIEKLVALPSMQRVIIFDTKSADLTMMLEAAGLPGAAEAEAEAAFGARAEIRVFTFASDHGWKATLSDLGDMKRGDDFDPQSADEQGHCADWRFAVQRVIKGLLVSVGLVIVDADSNIRLIDPLFPASIRNKGGFSGGLAVETQKHIGTLVTDAVVLLLEIHTAQGAAVPTTFRELAEAVDPANHPADFDIPVGLELDDFTCVVPT